MSMKTKGEKELTKMLYQSAPFYLKVTRTIWSGAVKVTFSKPLFPENIFG
jgi:hypothetical protein